MHPITYSDSDWFLALFGELFVYLIMFQFNIKFAPCLLLIPLTMLLLSWFKNVISVNILKKSLKMFGEIKHVWYVYITFAKQWTKSICVNLIITNYVEMTLVKKELHTVLFALNFTFQTWKTELKFVFRPGWWSLGCMNLLQLRIPYELLIINNA